LWTHDGTTDYTISVSQLRNTFSEVGALWLQNTDQLLQATPQRLTMGSLSYDEHNFTDTNSTGTFYIKDDTWSYIRLTAGFILNDGAYGYGMAIYKNGAQYRDKLAEHYDEFNSHHGGWMGTGIIPVSSGDYFEIWNIDERIGSGVIFGSNMSYFCLQPQRMT
jgi:hypothetical protein